MYIKRGNFRLYFESNSEMFRFLAKERSIKNKSHCDIFYWFPLYEDVMQDKGNVFDEETLENIYIFQNVYGNRVGAFLPIDIFRREEKRYELEQKRSTN